MRADRLVAILLLLQTRQRVTAAEVAEELEISERTARRDLDALAASGVPLYSQRGRGGGWSLIGGARTDLSGLSAAEARALFLVAGPSSEATPEVRSALRKLLGALPEPFRASADAAAGAIVVDPARWGGRRDADAPEHLDALQEAVVDGEQVRLGYRRADGTTSDRVVHPLGLTRKGVRWYLITDTADGRRTFRVDRVRSVERTGEPAVRPDGFDLAAAWDGIVAEVDERRMAVSVRAAVEPAVLRMLWALFDHRLSVGGTRDDGRVLVEVRGPSAEVVANELAGWGRNVEVLGPDAARRRLAVLGAELAQLYDPATG
ncbi:MAG: WYL domain-containing protein [Actinomycetota bacterium]|nr:WYL domain-containing protein [Actinomycetota bacterium]